MNQSQAALLTMVAIAGIATSRPVRAQPVVSVVLTGRVVDRVDSIPLVGVVVVADSMRDGIRHARTDSSGRFAIRGRLRVGATSLSVRNVFYLSSSKEVEIVAAGAHDLGVVSLERGPEPAERMLIPWCERVTQRPPALAPGTWLNEARDSAGRPVWHLCDGLAREPRVSGAPAARNRP